MTLEMDTTPGSSDPTLKRKKSKKHAKEAVPMDVEEVVVAPAVEEDEKERKRRRKEEKRKAKAEAKAASISADTPDASVEPEKETKKSKKDKKKKAAEQTEPAPASDVTSPSEPEKKKKRKRDETTTEVATPEVASPSKRSKKDKKKKHALAEPSSASSPTVSAPQASTSAPNAPSSSDVEAYFAEHSISMNLPQGSGPIVPAMSFASLKIPAAFQAAFKGFDKPTPVQACTWPPALEGRDVVGIAETGSGKTLAFGVPALARLVSSKSTKTKSPVRVLVLAPTRELAVQSHDTLSHIGSTYCSPPIHSIAIYGGVDKTPQIKALRSPDTKIVVGTPGRILDLVSDGSCDLSGVEYLVLDEADRMLDKGFENDIRRIVEHIKPIEERQTLMFSATWPDAVRRLAATFQKDPVRVTIGSDDLTANARVAQVVEVFDDDREKDFRLFKHLQILSPKKKHASDPESDRVLIFVLYKKEATRVEATLKRSGYSVEGLHGDMSQGARLAALQAFKDGTTRLLVATDVAARGLDIPNVACVLNYSFPLTIEDYIHRIGRTGRGGKSGKSITFFTGDKHERALAGELARVLRDGGFDSEPLQKFPMTIRKKTHSVYGAFFRDDVDMSAVPKKITFDD